MNTVTLIQSLILTAVGMIVVFAFMGALIFIVHFYVAFATRFFPDKDEGPSGDNTGANGANGANEAKPDSTEKVAATIAAAIVKNGAAPKRK
jgi:sodium pump decarboxylase gamma subunit